MNGVNQLTSLSPNILSEGLCSLGSRCLGSKFWMRYHCGCGLHRSRLTRMTCTDSHTQEIFRGYVPWWLGSNHIETRRLVVSYPAHISRGQWKWKSLRESITWIQGVNQSRRNLPIFGNALLHSFRGTALQIQGSSRLFD
jgi:hypothetical protein